MSQLVELNQGDTNATITIAVLQDELFEEDEVFSVQLVVPPNPHQVDAGQPSTTMVTILDDDSESNPHSHSPTHSLIHSLTHSLTLFLSNPVISVTLTPSRVVVTEGDIVQLAVFTTGALGRSLSVTIVTRTNTTTCQYSHHYNPLLTHSISLTQ